MLSELFALQPASHRWPKAVEAAAAVVIPPVLGTILGEPVLGAVASIGSLIVLHLPDRTRRERATALPLIAAALLIAACVGALVGAALLPSLIAMAVFAALGSFLAQALSVGPPGALFLVLAVGSAGQLVAPVVGGGAGLPLSGVIIALAAGSAIGYLVVILPLVLPRVRQSEAAAYAARSPWRFAVTPGVRVVSARIAVAAALSVPVSAFLGLHHGAWVLLACLGILQKDADIHSALVRGTQRLIGTALAIVLILVLAVVDPTGLGRTACAAAFIFLFELLLRRNLTWALAFVTPMSVLLASTAGESLSEVADERILDTAAGAAVAGLVLMGAILIERRAARRRSG